MKGYKANKRYLKINVQKDPDQCAHLACGSTLFANNPSMRYTVDSRYLDLADLE